MISSKPDLSSDGLGDWIVKATEAIDEMVTTIKPQPDLESTVVTSHTG